MIDSKDLEKAIEYSYKKAHTCTFKELDSEDFPTHDLSAFLDFISSKKRLI